MEFKEFQKLENELIEIENKVIEKYNKILNIYYNTPYYKRKDEKKKKVMTKYP